MVSADRVHRAGTLINFNGDVDEKHINGTVNGGGTPIKVDGRSGSVHLNFK